MRTTRRPCRHVRQQRDCKRKKTEVKGSVVEELGPNTPKTTYGHVVLERVDLKRDRRIFALLDEGCNRTYHTPAVCEKYQKLRKPGPLSGQPRSYSGIGGCTTRGRREFDCHIGLPDNTVVRASMASHELGKGEYPVLLLSLKVQSTLG